MSGRAAHSTTFHEGAAIRQSDIVAPASGSPSRVLRQQAQASASMCRNQTSHLASRECRHIHAAACASLTCASGAVSTGRRGSKARHCKKRQWSPEIAAEAAIGVPSGRSASGQDRRSNFKGGYRHVDNRFHSSSRRRFSHRISSSWTAARLLSSGGSSRCRSATVPTRGPAHKPTCAGSFVFFAYHAPSSESGSSARGRLGRFVVPQRLWRRDIRRSTAAVYINPIIVLLGM